MMDAGGAIRVPHFQEKTLDHKSKRPTKNPQPQKNKQEKPYYRGLPKSTGTKRNPLLFA